FHRTFEHEGRPGHVDVDDRHAVQRTALVLAGCGVDDVVGTDHHGDVDGLHTGVDVSRLHQLLVRHVGLSQQHVHVPGHAPCHRVDGVAHLCAVGLEQVGELFDDVLRLGDG